MVSTLFVFLMFNVLYLNEYNYLQITSMVIKMKKNEIHKNNTAYIIEKEIDYKFLIL